MLILLSPPFAFVFKCSGLFSCANRGGGEKKPVGKQKESKLLSLS